MLANLQLQVDLESDRSNLEVAQKRMEEAGNEYSDSQDRLARQRLYVNTKEGELRNLSDAKLARDTEGKQDSVSDEALEILRQETEDAITELQELERRDEELRIGKERAEKFLAEKQRVYDLAVETVERQEEVDQPAPAKVVPSPTPLPKPTPLPSPTPDTSPALEEATHAYDAYVNANENNMDVDTLIGFVNGIHTNDGTKAETFKPGNSNDRKVFNRLASEAQKLCKDDMYANESKIQQIKEAVKKMGSVFAKQLERRLSNYANTVASHGGNTGVAM
jgi:hypothetical protein